MRISRQRLGDNPRDHDGRFEGLDDAHADVSGARPDVDYVGNKPEGWGSFEPWVIYPRPPPPRWHWSDKETLERRGSEGKEVGGGGGDGEFRFEECWIPEGHEWGFEIDEKGVYQVYEDVEGEVFSLVSRVRVYLF
jgi:AMP deaminase